MNTHYLRLSSVIFLLYHTSVEISCRPPFAETVLECGECLSECWLQGLLHLLCAFWSNLSLLHVNSSLFLKPFLVVLFQLLSYSLLNLFIFVLFVFKSLQRCSFIISKLLDKLSFFFFEDNVTLLINLFILKLRKKLPFWNPMMCFSVLAYPNFFQDCFWWRIFEDQSQLSLQITHLLFGFDGFFQERYHSKLKLLFDFPGRASSFTLIFHKILWSLFGALSLLIFLDWIF